MPDCARRAHEAMLSFMEADLAACGAYMQGKVAEGARLHAKGAKRYRSWLEERNSLSPAPGKRYEP